MRVVLLSIAAALALGSAAFAQSQTGNPSGQSRGNAAENRGQGGDARVRTKANAGSQDSRRDMNVNVRIRSGNDSLVHRRSRHRVIVGESRQPDVVIIKKKKRFVKRSRNRVIISGVPESRTTMVRHSRAPVVVRQRVNSRTSVRTSRPQQPVVSVRERTKIQSGTTGVGNNNQGQVKQQAPNRGEGNPQR